MKEYLQPHFYHFSQDPIVLAEMAFEKFIQKIKRDKFNLIDLCSGSGICGIEFIRKFSSLEKKFNRVLFIEKQFEFMPFLEWNVDKFLSNQFISEIYFNSLPLFKFNRSTLVVCNPPFYLEGEGRNSENRNKNMCNFIAKNDARIIINWIEQMLKLNQGNFFFQFILPKKSFWVKLFDQYQLTYLRIECDKLSSREIISNF